MERTRALPYVPALDGVRGVAVLAVLLFHGGVSWLPGGFLGVDAFFVLSGYLITSLLLAGQPLREFWERRARRLLPALLLLVGVVLLAGAVTPLAAAPRDAVGALTYLSNWRSYATGGGYFASFAEPSAFKHTWSLAVEAQFYVLWPLVVVHACRRARAPVLAAAGVGALASAVAMAASFTPFGDPARAYYGTDTRIQALLVGAALAVVLTRAAAGSSGAGAAAGGTGAAAGSSGAGAAAGGTGAAAAARSSGAGEALPTGPGPWPDPPGGPACAEPAARPLPRPGRPGVLTASGLAGVALTLWAWRFASGSDRDLYGGGFLLAAVGTAAVIASVVLVPAGPLARALAWRPLRLAGRVSYGVYLWHWPVFLLLTRSRTGLAGPALLAVRLAVTAACTAVSWHAVEVPARTWSPRLPAFLRLRPRRVAVAGALAFAVAAAFALTPGGSVGPPAAVAGEAAGPAPATTAPARAGPGAGAAGAARPAARRPAPTTAAPAPPTTAAPPRGGTRRVLFLGDSVAQTLAAGLPDGDGFDVVNEAQLGCGIVTGEYRYFGGQYRDLPQCATWPDAWAAAVARHRPALVAVLVGRWEVMDRRHDGEWRRLGDAEFDAYVAAQLDRAAGVLAAGGATVVFLTAPYYQRGERPDGGRYSEDDPARVDRFNTLLREVAARRGVAVVELGAALAPEGTFTRHINGTLVRYDGVHVSGAGARLLRPWLLRQLRAIA